MSPPKPQLTWAQVVDLEFLSTIEILRGRPDVRHESWAQDHFRRASSAWHKLQRAKEELVSINIEARRLWTSIANEEIHLNRTLESLYMHNPNLASFLRCSYEYRVRANEYLQHGLRTLEALPSYAGKRGPGIRLCDEQSPAPTPTPCPLLPTLSPLAVPMLNDVDGEDWEDDEDEDEDDNVAILDKLIDTLDNIDINGL